MSVGVIQARVADFMELSEAVLGMDGVRPLLMAEALRDTVHLLESLNVPYALFGAHAVAAYVPERRSTLDIDFLAPRESMDRVREHAPGYGLTEEGRDDADVVLRFRHRSGVPIDMIFDAAGFADLDRATSIQLPDVGTVRVADVVDVAYCKLRTQRRDWKRAEEKRSIDWADLIAIIKANPGVVRDLVQRIRPRASAATRGANAEMESILNEACRAAGFAPPDDSLMSRLPKRWLVLFAALAIVLMIAIAAWLIA